ncbi:MAG: transposase [Clostridium sp.]
MTTKPVIWVPGAIYHVTSRGNRKEEIFKDTADYYIYLTNLQENIKRYEELNYQLLAYCLMTNHVHLIIKTDKEPLERLMKRVNSMYTRYFNSKYDYVGHLFQGRYHGEIIKGDAQLIETSRYVHLNPVRANMVEKPEEYKWSSYKMYIAKEKDELLELDVILHYFNYKNEAYKRFVELQM